MIDRLLVCVLALTFAGPSAIGQDPEIAFDADQLEQLVAPIALYPDSLLGHVLMAATYPLEVIDAERFVRANPSLGGEPLRAVVADKPWNPAVKALIVLPDVLAMMSENLDWMRDLGDAFLAQRTQLLDAVQRLRARARNSGALTSSAQQSVEVKDQDIVVIESASPDIVYVPHYSPLVVYGPGWGYSHWHYPGFFYPGYWRYGHQYGWGAGIGFSIGVSWGGWLWAGMSWGSGFSDVFLIGWRYDQFDDHWHHGRGHHHGRDGRGRPDGHDGGRGGADKRDWTHEPAHRRGVRYRDQATARRFGDSGERLVPKDQARGFPGKVSPPSKERGERSTPPARVDRAPQQKRAEPAPAQPRRDIRPVPQQRQPRDSGQIPKAGNTWKGSRSPSLDRKAAERGNRSRGSAPSPSSGHKRSATPAPRGKSGGGTPQRTGKGK
jgi:hypothetical protein